MKNKKYKLTDETSSLNGVVLHRIVAVRDFWDVKAGDLGGWVESEENLSHEGECWIDKDAMVFADAKILGNAYVTQKAVVCNDAIVDGDAVISGRALVGGNARIHGLAYATENAYVTGNAIVYGNASVSGQAYVCGNAVLNGHEDIQGDARVTGADDHMFLKGPWSDTFGITYTASDNCWQCCGFRGTSEEFLKTFKEKVGEHFTALTVIVNTIEMAAAVRRK